MSYHKKKFLSWMNEDDISPNDPDIARDPDGNFTVVVSDESGAHYIDKEEFDDAAHEIEHIIKTAENPALSSKYNFKKLIEGNEAITFQVSSPLAKELCALFQKGIDYYEAYPPYTGIGNASTYADEKMHDIIVFTKKTIVPGFKAIVLKYTNFTVNRVFLPSEHGPFKPTGMFAVDISFNNIRGFLTQYEQMIGMSKAPNAKQVDLQKFMSMAENWAEDSPKLKESQYGPSPKSKYAVDIYFDSILAFAGHDFIPNKLDIENMKADEITAIMLHELGHANTVVERSGDFFYRYRYVKTNITEIIEEGMSTPAKRKELNKTLSKQLATFSKDKGADSKTIEVLVKANTVVAEAMEKREESKASWLYSIFEFVVILCRLILVYAVLLAYGWLAIRWVLAIATEASEAIQLGMGHSDANVKKSDVLFTGHNLRLVERMADEYVSRHGMSGPLASGLNKLIRIMKYTYATGTMNPYNQFRSTKVAALFFKFVTAMFGLLGITDGYNLMYEEDHKRIGRMAQNTIGAFKKSSLPKDVLDAYIKDYEETVAVFNTHRTYTDRGIKALHNLCDVITNPMRWISLGKLFFSSNTNHDYEVLIDRVDELSNNKLHYIGAKLNQLKEDISK